MLPTATQIIAHYFPEHTMTVTILHHTATLSSYYEGCIDIDITYDGINAEITVGQDEHGTWTTSVWPSDDYWLSNGLLDELDPDEIIDLAAAIDAELRQDDLDALAA